MMRPKQVFIIDDDAAVRDAVLTLVESVGLRGTCFTDADAFLSSPPPAYAGCLITDVCLPGTDGVQLQRILAERGMDMPLIAMSAHGDIAMAVEMVRRGAIDFIEKPFRNHVLLERIRDGLAIAEQRHSAQTAKSSLSTRLGSLTPREKDILPLLVDGRSNKAIASELALSPRTVETHRANILRKMQTDSVTTLTRLLADDLSRT